MRGKVFFLIFCSISAALFAQRGRDGNLTVSTTVEVNEYTYLTANAPAGSTVITVANSTLNAHGRFLGNLAAGDLIMIIQMQGASLNGRIDPPFGNVGLPDDSSWGSITNYNNCGNYEFAEVNAVPSGTTIKLDCPLGYNYIDTGKVQIVRVPRYNTLTINNGGTIACDQWDSAIGGIIAIEVKNNTVINSGGSINADSAGFRGGLYHGQDSVGWGVSWFSSTFQSLGKEKGEGIGGYEWNYTKYGGKEGMGAPGNGGGGGNVQNGGGGGGANGGVIAKYINGFGNPDISTPNYRTAWNLEYTWMSSFTSSGGGRGGYSYSANNSNPLVDGPNNSPAWAGDQRRNVGGRGGRPLDYSTGRLFMGGGGGAGDQNDGYGGKGGRGGGLIYLMNYGTVSGTGQIIANGENGFNTPDPTPAVGHASGIDAAGGAGAGGTIIVNSVGTISGITLTANGGTGGNQVMNWNISTDKEAEGPGGGGSGGYIATSNGGLTENVTGGHNGTTNAIPMANFPANGATIGDTGTKNATITNFYLGAIPNDTICSGLTATLTESILGTPPGGITIEWYTVDSGGISVGSGASYTTPVLTTTTTYYVSTCPGTYRIPVTVVVIGAGAVTVSPNNNICKGSSDSLNATGGTAYSWLPIIGLSNPNIANPVATPTATTTYTVSVTTTCGIVKDSIKVTVIPLPNIILSASSNPICVGQSATITATGGTTYSWSNGATTSSITITPPSTTIYTLSVANGGCTKDTTVMVTVSSTLLVNITPAQKVCPGKTVILKATGGGTYRWSTGATTDSITVSPTTNTNYNVTVTNGCTGTASTSVNIYNPTLLACCDTIIQSGNSTHLISSGAGITNFAWAPPTNINCDTCADVIASPTITTTYTVTAIDSGCLISRVIVVTVEEPCDTLIIPNVFTPTNAGIYGLDNVFYIKTGNFTSWSLNIFDRWGKEVFKTTNPNQYWTGNTESGGPAPAGIYYYLIKASCNGTATEKQGFVQLIR